jgi:hypothetical protein
MSGEIPTWVQAITGSTVVVTVLGWLGKREVARIDNKLKRVEDLDQKKADRDEIKELMQLIRETEASAQRSRAEIYSAIRQAVEHQSNTNVKVAEALGELKGALNKNRR